MPLYQQHKLAHTIALIRLGYQRRWLSIDVLNPSSAVWFKQLLLVLQKCGVLAHVEPIFTNATIQPQLKYKKQTKKLRLYLRYINGRPAARVWVSTTAGQRTHRPSLSALRVLSQTYAGLHLIFKTPQGLLTLEDCIRLRTSGVLWVGVGSC